MQELVTLLLIMIHRLLLGKKGSRVVIVRFGVIFWLSRRRTFVMGLRGRFIVWAFIVSLKWGFIVRRMGAFIVRLNWRLVMVVVVMMMFWLLWMVMVHRHFLHHCNRHSYSRVHDESADEDGGHGEGEGDEAAVGELEPREVCGDVNCRDRRNRVPRCGESPAWACSEVVATEA